MSRSIRLVALAVAVLLVAVPVASADNNAYLEEAQGTLKSLEGKFVGLAEAVSADKYTWRPADDVRSISEVFLHVAAANYGIARAFGKMPPEGLNLRGLDKSTTDKAETIAKLKAGFAHIADAISSLGAGDAEKPMKMFGQDTTARGALHMMLGHAHEHLGQSIAYARVNGVTPPWNE